MGIALTVAAYVSAVIFIWRVVWHVLLWSRTGSPAQVSKVTSFSSVFMAAVDIIFLRRLFMVNKGLWVGEWLFHMSFVFVILRHLRYFFYDVPGFVAVMQPVGVYAGYVLPFSLLYILIYRFVGEKQRYFSTYNLFLTAMLFLIGISGFLLRTVYRTDVTAVKAYLLGGLMLNPAQLPESNLFIVHFILTILFVPFLPTHIFAAPVIALEVRRREEGVDLLVHEKR